MMNKNIMTILLAASVITVGMLAGCGRQDADHDHDHGDEKGHEHKDGDGHNHGEKKGADAHGHGEKEEGHGEEVSLTEEGVKKSGIRIERAGKHLLTDVIHAPGRVAFNAEKIAHVGAPVSGRVAEIKVRIGDQVNAGDVLMNIQSPQLGEAQSNYLLKKLAAEAADPMVELAKASLDRARNLYQQSEGITLAELQKREAEYKSSVNAQLTARAEVTAAENMLHLLGADNKAIETLVKTGEINPVYAVRAPIAGQIVEREITLGEHINPEREALAVIADMTSLWILADVPESRLAQVRVGTEANVKISDIADQSVAGRIAFIAPSIQPETRTAQVRVELSSAQTLRPGQFVQVSLTTVDTQERALAIPEEATQLVEGETVVFVPVEGEANTFAKRPIKTGSAVGRLLPVLSGLNEGDLFVAAGSFILKAQHGKGSAEHEH